MFDFIMERLKERSTWVGLVGLATSGGISLNPENIEAIVTVGTTVAGLIATVVPDKK